MRQTDRQTVTYSLKGVNFQMRDPCYVDRITNVGIMQSYTNINIHIDKRFFYLICLNKKTSYIEKLLSNTDINSCGWMHFTDTCGGTELVKRSASKRLLFDIRELSGVTDWK
jgi:hypothetical protein